MSERNYYVFCEDNCKFEGMTKEQIIEAIAEATGTTPTQIDDAFITKIKEQNHNSTLKFWKGTQAEYNAITPQADTYYIITDNSEIRELQRELSEVEDDVQFLETFTNGLNSTVNKVAAHEMIGSRYQAWYHVDADNGSDLNDGFTWGTAFKTLERCIEIANMTGAHDLRIALLESTTSYTMPDAAIACQVLHITGFLKNGGSPVAYSTACNSTHIPPIRLYFSSTERPLAMYATHVNFTGLSIDKANVTAESGSIVTRIYSDGGCVYFSCCEVKKPYQQNGGSLIVSGSYVASLVAKGATVRFVEKTTTFKNAALPSSASPYRLLLNEASTCSVDTDGTTTGLTFEIGSVAYIYVKHSTLAIRNDCVINSPTITASGVNALTTRQSIIFMSETIKTGFNPSSCQHTIWAGGNNRLNTGEISTF